MTASERAFQIWPILVFCSTKRQILTYDELGKLIGVPNPGLGQLLEPIQSFCILNRIPALSSIVVGINTGTPGKGFIAAEDLSKEQAKVFTHDWFQCHPTVHDFENALRNLPSNGSSLSELLKQIS